jgi:hypothetical protein
VEISEVTVDVDEHTPSHVDNWIDLCSDSDDDDDDEERPERMIDGAMIEEIDLSQVTVVNRWF